MTKQTKTNSWSVVLSFENEDDRTSFSKYYMPKVETKDYNELVNGKGFFSVPVKSKRFKATN